MQGFPLLLRCLALASMACLACGASPIAAWAAEGKPAGLMPQPATDDDLLLDDSVTWTRGVSDDDLSGHDSEWMDEEIGEATFGAGTSRRFADIMLAPDQETLAGRHAPIAAIGPFRLVDATTLEMVGTVDSASPRAFASLLAAHPGIRRLVMIECPGSVDETANHALARAIRRAGISTHVPRGGSVRSGAVDLFLAGVERTAEPGAEFGVHSWRDEDGYEAGDFPEDDPVHAEYLDYYREMGLDPRTARAFYALTNSVGFDDVRVLSAGDMARLGLAHIAG